MNKVLSAMPCYEAYKDSGIEWLGEIPANWNIKKLKHLGYIYAGLAGKKGDHFSKEKKDSFSPFVPFTSISNDSIVVERYQYVLVKSYEEQNLVKKNDILFLMSSETLEDIAKCSLYTGVQAPLYLNSFCKGFRITSKLCMPAFINYLFQCDLYRKYFGKVARGFTRINLKQEYVNNASVNLPPIAEQKAIAAFLDRKTAQIDQAVAIKEKQIALLRERKQILIQNAVTRGLDPNVPMRDSGVEWIGTIPAHWSVKPITKYARRVDYRGKTPNKVDEGVFLITTRNIKEGKIDYDISQEFIDQRQYNSVMSRGFPQVGDLLFTMEAPLGNVAVIDKPKVAIAQRIIKFRFTEGFNSDFVCFSMQAGYFQSFLQKEGTGSTAIGIKASKLFKLKLITPPIKEQKTIVEFIKIESKKVDDGISIQKQQISKLKEYKATLINSAVTGKIKVTG